MEKTTTAERLRELMFLRSMKQVDILLACKPFCEEYNVKLGKNDLSQYISGKVQPGQDKLTVLGKALGVNEVWLMGYDIPKESDGLQTFKEAIVSEDEAVILDLYRRLDSNDRIEIRGEMKGMLKSDKYKA